MRDTEIGIPAKDLARTFEMFSQVTPPIERAAEGLGIGLALVRGLLELLGGSIHASSAGPGKGSEFIVRLPLARADSSSARSPMAVRESMCAAIRSKL